VGLLKEMRFWKHTARDTSGAEIAEAAIVLPLVFMLLLGIYWLGAPTYIRHHHACGSRRSSRRPSSGLRTLRKRA
jgi:hypothetical protein